MKENSSIYPGQTVAILGLGISGRAAMKYAMKCGAKVRISDSRTKERFIAEEGELLASGAVDWEAGGHSYEFLRQADLVLVSPGVSLQMPVLQLLRNDGGHIAGELAVAAGKVAVPVIAVTGTNGKTTVTTLIGELLRSSGKKVFVGGNIGTPLYEYLIDPDGYDAVVVEVSSFQLESGGEFSPNIGVLLNITPDHLDRHGSLERYGQVKKLLFANQKRGDLAIINGDDPLCQTLSPGVLSDIQTFGLSKSNTAVIDGQLVCLCGKSLQEEYNLAGTAFANSVGLQNSAAAILAVRRLGVAPDVIRTALAAFRLLPHRIEFVAEVAGVKYFNDSKATNTGAVLGALEQFAGNVILIAGGRDKADDYRLLRDSVAARVRHLLVIGEAAGLLQEALADLVETTRANSLQEAVDKAAALARPGDTVLLSPACASFDMFKSYGHRGNEFKKAVQSLQVALNT